MTSSRSQPLYLVSHGRALESSEEMAPVSQAPLSRRSGIPSYPNAFVGRTAELATLDERVFTDGARLVTIHGPGGMGKTRLVSAWAERTAASGRDVAYAALASLASSEHFAPVVAIALGLTVDPKTDPRDDILRTLKNRAAILVLDNLEQLVADPRVTKWIQTILDRCPKVTIVATSRERLGLAAEHVVELGGLAVPIGDEPMSEAVELFERRAQQVQSTFDADANASAIVAICRLLEGVPLGIELAATWVRLLGCEEILAEIKKTLDFLTADPRSGRDPRQSSMRAVFAQSWALLRQPEQRALARLSVFRGGFDRAAAERVAGASLPLLAGLVDRSLVRTRATGRTTRYDMHELLRQFAAEQLDAADADRGVPGAEARGSVATAHAEHFAAVALAVHPQLRGEGQVHALAELTSDVDNYRAALEFSLGHRRYDLAARIGWALWPFWWIRNMQREGRAWMERLMPHTAELDVFWRTQATIAMGSMLYAQGDVEACVRFSHELVKLAAESNNDPRALAFAHGGFGLGATAKGDFETAAAELRKSRALFLEAGDPGIAAQAAAWMGTVQLLHGNLDRAREAATAALDEALAAGDRLANASARYCLARIAIAAGELDQAATHLLESIPPSLAIEDRGSLSYVFELLGVVCVHRRSFAHAARLFGASDAILEAIGSRGHTYYLPDTKGMQRSRDEAAAALGDAVFDEAYAIGRRATIDELVEAAGSLDDTAAASAEPAGSPGTEAAPLPSAAPPATAMAPVPFQVRYFEEDDSVFLGQDYLIKGIPGRLLWRMLQIHASEGRNEFTNREFRLDPALKLPGYKDNLETRLLLLGKRLAEKKAPLQIERSGRGRLRLVITGIPGLSSTPAKT